MHAFEKELAKKIKLKQDTDEERDEFLERIVKEAAALEDDDFEKLSVPLQDWINDATKAKKDKKKITDFAEEDEGDEKAARGGAKAKAKAEPKEAKKRGGSEGGMSSMMFIRYHLVDNPAATVDEVSQALVKAGYNAPSNVTISTMRSEFRSLTKILAEKNLFKQGVQLGKL